ncbi:DMT family transporter [Pseudomonas sp. Gutcm_11s]|uniref:DMT family transporter n=1 Tax=Pseudomonas sp. Gutcm_11s TaxID=3026088 RepID=UPI00235F95B8|nr:DMT family transporter [Pseudomonas sp. Gutcm_11s]MDD0841333.1 DMT family transporter [Pseudomonas sp. Gutcm_11s]
MRSADSAQQTGEQTWLWCAATIFSLIAFAANSVFCRLALRSGDIDPDSFTAIRLLGGALVLLPLCLKPLKSGASRGTWRGGFYLFVYAYLFSLAYVQLDAGVGALILFGAVQITMFALGMRGGEKLQMWVVLGMLMAFSGLIVLLAPGGSAPPLVSALFMAVAGIAWGCYSVLGKRSESPARDTAGNFLRSLPPMVIVAVIGLSQASLHITPTGAIYAIASGVLASGAGYVVWYAVVKRLRAQTAATLQLSVPVLASIAGVVLLSEPLSARMVAASLIVLGGIALALLGAKR